MKNADTVHMAVIETEAENCLCTTEKLLEDDYRSSQERIKPYTFRKLNSTDLFPMIKLIAKIGLDELTEVFEGDAVKQLIERVGSKEKAAQGREIVVGVGVALKLVNKILEHIPCCEAEIYTLLSRVSGMGVEELKNLDLDVFMEMLLDFIMKDEFRDFFKVASKYINRLG